MLTDTETTDLTPKNSLAVPGHAHVHGFTLVELLVSVVIAAILLTGLVSIIGGGLASSKHVTVRNALNDDAQFAMERMVQAVRQSSHLQLPMADDIRSAQFENIRSQTVPALAGATETAVLAVTISPTQDLDGDGVVDADSDNDGQIDEDPHGDINYDNHPGIKGIDDDGDGLVDGLLIHDDDEDGNTNEDKIDGIDNDGDGRIDEDPPSDQNDDGAPGIIGVDDNLDGIPDNRFMGVLKIPKDDDEDQLVDEDGPAYSVFYLSGSQLIERVPIPWSEGRQIIFGIRITFDYINQRLADDVSYLSFSRPAIGNSRSQLVNIIIELTADSGESVRLESTARLGAAL